MTGTVRGSTSVAVNTIGYNPPPPPTFNFNAGTPMAGTAGSAYRYCYCSPDPGNPNGLCGFPTQGNPSGGNPPYHFQLNSGVGFPPIGIILGLNGCLTGTPSAAGKSNFSVCAIDLNGSQVCVDTSVTVTGPSGSETWTGTFTGTDTPNYCPRQSQSVYGENGTLNLQFPAPGLVAVLSSSISGANTLIGGSFTTTESVARAVSGCTLSPHNVSGSISTTLGGVYSSPPTIVLWGDGASIIPEGDFLTGGWDTITLQPTTITATAVSGNWNTCTACTQMASGTFQLAKQ